jgi:hypothetical protein
MKRMLSPMRRGPKAGAGTGVAGLGLATAGDATGFAGDCDSCCESPVTLTGEDFFDVLGLPDFDDAIRNSFHKQKTRLRCAEAGRRRMTDFTSPVIKGLHIPLIP